MTLTARLALVLLTLCLALPSPPALGQLTDDRYLANPNAIVHALRVMPDGRVLVAGNFTEIAGVSRTRLARLHHDGTVDTSFSNININGVVHTVIRRSNGKLVIGGSFTQVGGQARQFLAQLNDNGTLDTSFVPPAPSSTVFALALDSDGSLLIGGEFPQVGGQPRTAIARLSETGVLDPDFAPTLNGTVRAIQVLHGGRVVIGGEFTLVNGQTRNRIASIDRNGGLHGGFIANANGTVNALIELSDGSFLAGGSFTQVQGKFRNRLVRLKQNGLVDPDFFPRVSSGIVFDVAEQRDGRLLVAGQFNLIDDLPRSGIARLNRFGTVLPSSDFDTQTDPGVRAVVELSTGQVVFAGLFGQVNGSNRSNLARVERNGHLPRNSASTNTFRDTATGISMSFSEHPDGSVAVGGDFSHFNITPRTAMLKLTSGGDLVSGYNPAFISTNFDPDGRPGEVRSLALLENGRLLVGGNFSHLNNTSNPRRSLARLFASGNQDTGFTAQATRNPVLSTTFAASLYPISNTEVFVGGLFTALAGQSRPHFGKLLGSTIDFSFPFLGFDDTVNTVVPQVDGQLLVGGLFGQVGGTIRRRVLRVSAAGAVDANFNPAVSSGSLGNVQAISPRRDGSILIAGLFSEVNGSPTGGIAALNANGSLDTSFGVSVANVTSQVVLADQTILIGGSFSSVNGISRGRLALINEDGSLNSSVPNMQFNDFIGALHVQSNGVLLVGGRFSQMLGTERRGLVRLALREPPRDGISHTESRLVIWSLGGSAPLVVVPPTLSISTNDGATWTELGTMTRTLSSWRRTSVNRPLNQHYQLRVQAILVSSTGSVSRIERRTAFYHSDRIFESGLEES